MQDRIGLDVGGHIEGADGEGDDSRVALGDKLVLGEAFDVEKEVRRKRVEEAVALARVKMLLRLKPVVFGEDGG